MERCEVILAASTSDRLHYHPKVSYSHPRESSIEVFACFGVVLLPLRLVALAGAVKHHLAVLAGIELLPLQIIDNFETAMAILIT
tara:strand:- start:2370 stop:2624 length:255 start_codon:yes stop_codon:yes gene_type:complete